MWKPETFAIIGIAILGGIIFFGAIDFIGLSVAVPDASNTVGASNPTPDPDDSLQGPKYLTVNAPRQRWLTDGSSDPVMPPQATSFI